MHKICLVVLFFIVGLGSAGIISWEEYYNFVDNETCLYNSTDFIKPSGFENIIIVYTVYNSTNQVSSIYYQDLILFSDDKYIVDKINELEAATVWC